MRLLLLFAVTALLVTSASIAEEPTDKDLSQLETWIEMLDSPKYRDRAEATAKLQRSGGWAIEALERIVTGGSSEASDRALGILKHHYNNDDEVLKEVSAEALQRIAGQTEHAKSKAAQRILEPAEPTPSIIPFPNLRLPNLAPVNRQTKIRISVTNGVKDITVEENGKAIRVIENGDGIQVEKKNGNGKVVKTKYKDAAELKEKDADAHKAYQKATAGGGIRIQMQQHGIPNLPGQLQIVPQPFQPQQLQKQLEDMRKQLEENRRRHAEMHEKQLKRHEEMLERIRNMRAVPPALPPQQPPIETKIIDPIEV